MAEAIHNDSAERAAVIFYGISLFVVSLLVSALCATIRSDRKLLKPKVPEYEIESITRAAAPHTVGLPRWHRAGAVLPEGGGGRLPGDGGDFDHQGGRRRTAGGERGGGGARRLTAASLRAPTSPRAMSSAPIPGQSRDA
jgi:hypothetical protein